MRKEKAIIAGLVSGLATTLSISNIAGWTNGSIGVGLTAFVDFVFGTGANSIAAATYRVSIDKSSSNNTGQQVRARRPNNYKRASII